MRRITKRCQFCRKADGELVYTPPEPGYRSARRGYNAVGEGPHYWHAECYARQEAFEAESRARFEAETKAMFAQALATLKEENK